MIKNNNLDNNISLARSGFQQAPRTLESGGVDYAMSGICRLEVGSADIAA
jgi:hypothetical protein